MEEEKNATFINRVDFIWQNVTSMNYIRAAGRLVGGGQSYE